MDGRKIGNPPILFDRPAALFLPASRPGAIERARTSDADLVILDLEDAVAAEQKDEAREAAVEAAVQDWPMPLAIRINGVGTPWHMADVAAIARSACDLAVVPSVRSAREVEQLRATLDHPIAAMIETAAAVLDVQAIARVANALIVGTNDLASELRLPQGAGRRPLATALQMTVLAARAAGVAVFDGVFNRLDDPDGLAAECAESRALGFDGKTLIHPDQIAVCRKAFRPSDEEIARAERLVEAASGGAQRFEGTMIEDMHVAAARRLLNRL